jgi:hypothetical protein
MNEFNKTPQNIALYMDYEKKKIQAVKLGGNRKENR